MVNDQGHDAARPLDRRTFLRMLGLGSGALLLSACQSAAPPASSKPAVSVPPAGSAPAASGASTEWDRVVAAAKQEGNLTIYGPPGQSFRTIHVDAFNAAFPEIAVDYQGANGSQQAPRLVAERQAGKFIADLYIGGATSPMLALLPIKAFDPVDEALILPEVKDTSKWFQNQHHYMETAGRYVFAFIGNAGATKINRHTGLVPPGALKKWGDLLDPQWRGKVASADPSVSGTLLGGLANIAADPAYGLDFIRKLYAKEQGVVITADDRQLTDWLAQGQYHIGIGVALIDEAIKIGLPLGQDPLDVVTIGPSFGCIMRVNQAPHPNAAKVYLNWLLSPEAQIAYQRERGDVSLRMDIPRDGVDPDDVPDPAVQYVNTQTEPFLPLRDEVRKVVAEVRAA